MKRILPLAVLLAVAVPSTAAAKPKVCRRATIREQLRASEDSVGAGIETIRCGDVTDDGAPDAVFTIASGGTAGATHFGVLVSHATPSGGVAIALYRSGYKVGVARVNSHRFDVEQPIYSKHDANCCPSAFAVTPYRFIGDAFKAGKAKRHKHAGKRFYD